VCISENAAALEELLLEYESKQTSKGSSIKYVTTHTVHTHKWRYAFAQSHCLRSQLTRRLGKYKRQRRVQRQALKHTIVFFKKSVCFCVWQDEQAGKDRKNFTTLLLFSLCCRCKNDFTPCTPQQLELCFCPCLIKPKYFPHFGRYFPPFLRSEAVWCLVLTHCHRSEASVSRRSCLVVRL